MTEEIQSQTKRILEYLKEGNAITPIEAFYKFNCLRLAARILNMKQLGYNIESEIVMIKTKKVKGVKRKAKGKKFAKYRLIQ